jgi:hypothetical protein
MIQRWANCEQCRQWFATPVRDPRRFCSPRCTGVHAKATGKFKGRRNPRWLGGVSQDVMRYRRRDRERWPEHHRARRKLEYAVKAGNIEKHPCAKCGSPASNGHHTDYSKPLDVVWLCRKHHDEEHARLKRERTR